MDIQTVLLRHYLREFNREYLSTAADRRQFGENLINGVLTFLLIIATAMIFLLV